MRMPAWRSPGKGVWQAPGDHRPAPIRAWLPLPPCFGILATAPSARSRPDPALPHALPPAPPAVGAKGVPRTTQPRTQLGDGGSARAQRKPKHQGALSQQGPIEPILVALLLPQQCTTWRWKERAPPRSEPLHAPSPSTRTGSGRSRNSTPRSLGLQPCWGGSSPLRGAADSLLG